MRKKIVLLFLVAVLVANAVLFQPTILYAETVSVSQLEQDLYSQVEQTLDELDFGDMETVLKNFDEHQNRIFYEKSFGAKVKSILSGELAVNYSSFFRALLDMVFNNVLRYIPLFAVVVAIGVMSGLLNNFKSKNGEKGVGDVIHFVCFCLIIVVISTSLTKLINMTRESIDSMKTQMDITFPILLTLTTALGASSSVGVYQPAVALLSGGITQIFTNIIFPLFIFAFVFCIIGNLSKSVKLDKYSSFISSIFKWLIGLIFTVFFAFLTIQGLSASSFDSVSIRTAKFTLKSYVPLMGGYLSEGFDLIMSSTILIKNAVGLTGIVVLVLSVLTPILNIMVFSLLLKGASAILQPLSDSRISNFLADCSKAVSMLMTCLLGIAFMYFLSTGLIMATANVL